MYNRTLYFGVAIGFALVLSIVSLRFTRQIECHYICTTPPCPTLGNCGSAPHAGFPLTVLRDKSGASPTSSWGRIDLDNIDDLSTFNSFHFLVNFLFYGACVWVCLQVFLVVQRQNTVSTFLEQLLLPILLITGGGLLAVNEALYILPATQNWVERTAIEGQWELVSPTGENPVILHFEPYQNGVGKIPNMNGNGEYRWASTDGVEISISSMERDFCANTLFFLQENCRATISDASGYPAPGANALPPSAYAYPVPEFSSYPAPDSPPIPAAINAYPSPIPEATLVGGSTMSAVSSNTIESSFVYTYYTVQVSNDTLTLTAEPGVTYPVLVFQRVDTP